MARRGARTTAHTGAAGTSWPRHPSCRQNITPRLRAAYIFITRGEVSPYLHDVLVVGDQIEVRGPIGGYIVWETGMGGPLLLMAVGSGIVPLMAMLRHPRGGRVAH